MKYLIVKQLSIDNHFLCDIWFQGLLSVYQKNKKIITGSLLKSLHIKHFASHHFPKYFHIIKKKRFLNIGHFFYRFVMVVCKNVLEYIIALVVVKNKVRLKKCLKYMTKFYCPNKSIYYFFKINTKLSTSFRPINVNKFLNWCPRDRSRGRPP